MPIALNEERCPRCHSYYRAQEGCKRCLRESVARVVERNRAHWLTPPRLEA